MSKETYCRGKRDLLSADFAESEYPSMISWCGCHPTLGTWGGEDRFEAYLYIIYVYMYMYMIYIYI